MNKLNEQIHNPYGYEKGCRTKQSGSPFHGFNANVFHSG